MPLYLHNTLTRKKEEFTPLDADNVRLYVCGPTVYARPHLGNARSVVVYDILYRLLQHLYPGKITYVRNITDVDDKINAAAKDRGVTIQELTAEVERQFHDDMAELGCLPPTKEPKATQHIAQMVDIIERLLANGYAYEAEGHVLFAVDSRANPLPQGEGGGAEGEAGEGKSQPQAHALTPALSHGERECHWHYGMLSGRKIDDLIAGARVEVAGYKRNPGDFVLWKPADADDDPSSVFDSPWGAGRPGWHIECSAMSTHYLGKTFDIHGGGADLKFPHHENEIAQSCCAYPGSGFARYWVHNGFLTVGGEKMAKSEGNFITVRDLLDGGMNGEVIRYAFLKTKYNEPLDWTDKLVTDAKKELDGFYRALQENEQSEILPGSFEQALLDDLNVPAALSVLHTADKHHLRAMGSLLGILQQNPEAWFKGALADSGNDEDEIENMVAARIAAKKARNWAEADSIRDELKSRGIILEDCPDGTTDWRRG